uniref:Reverse transcriptase Ty1/copia-type domain-containing protein n=1 Tax=Physcomitrium patens TaxID=3218 RepID=A0A7I3ZT86_PHYPA
MFHITDTNKIIVLILYVDYILLIGSNFGLINQLK